MHWLRVTLVRRSLAILVMASMASVAVASAEWEVQRSGPYANWVRAQLSTSNEAVEQALKRAAAQPSGSLEAFLARFIKAYEAQDPDASLASVFVDQDLTNDALIAYLQGRYGGMVSDGVLPRTALVQMTIAPALSSERQDLGAAVLADLTRTVLPVLASIRQGGERLFVLPLRLVWAAQPLGP